MNNNNTTANIYYPPGGILIWIVIFLELITFGVALLAMAYYANVESDIFHQSRLQLNIVYGSINTLFLLTSGYFMAESIRHLHLNNKKQASTAILFAMIGGALFLVVKSVEYSEKISAGLAMGVNTFWNFYWMLTLFHIVHVLVGLGILLYTYFDLKKDKEINLEDTTAGAAFWHMCDLIWLLLFPVLYLMF